LLQFHIANEETKFGLDLDEAKALLKSDSYQSMQNIAIPGVMGMASFTDNEQQVRAEFRMLKSIYEELHSEFSMQNFNILSFGMSGDYKIAIEEGSNMVRVGSSIFGGR
jgi:uncharacterized pyridoxal phosphate-containing UPF0001 family protein